MAYGERLFARECRLKLVGATLAAVGALALAGCSGNEDTLPASPAATAQAPTPAETQANASPSLHPILEFDYLDAGTPIIQVYPGVGDSAADRVANGTYNDGDSVLAECKTEGRTVSSDPSIGEEERTSNEWIRIQGTPGEEQYATAVYIKKPQDLLQKLPEC